MSTELIAKLKATEHGQWAHWLWDFLYEWRDYCEKGVKTFPTPSHGEKGINELKRLYDLADWLEGQAFKQFEREIPHEQLKLMEIYHRQKRREEETKVGKEDR